MDKRRIVSETHTRLSQVSAKLLGKTAAYPGSLFDPADSEHGICTECGAISSLYGDGTTRCCSAAALDEDLAYCEDCSERMPLSRLLEDHRKCLNCERLASQEEEEE